MKVDEWIEAFQGAITSYNTQEVAVLLHSLPFMATREELKRVLLLSMDAEVMLCEIRQKLVDKRSAIISQLV
ncbi:MAG: hypothetical protein NTY39_10095 [Campylobacterales bacterium]|nr:hypothetical protein [Campylobacterales bacterium]